MPACCLQKNGNSETQTKDTHVVFSVSENISSLGKMHVMTSKQFFVSFATPMSG